MKKTIVIASILKPSDDVRGFRKIAQSLVKTNKYEVNIIGNGGKIESGTDNIKLDTHVVYRAQWLKRIFLRYAILRKIVSSEPALIIITTHELLTVGLLAKWFCKAKIIYDIQENYYRNATMHGFIGRVVGGFIRIKEHFCTPFIDHYWLAEKCYQHELPFVKSSHTVVENKPLPIPMKRPSNAPIRALFSGTISNYSGVRRALQLMKALAEISHDFEGKFVGQIHDPQLEVWIKDALKTCPSISLECDRLPVSYDQIVKGIAWANVGIIAYLPNSINQHKTPTKLYEYARYQLPYFVQSNTYWHEKGTQLGGAIPVDFNHIDGSKLVRQLENLSNPFTSDYPDTETWEYESVAMVNSINTLFL